jgi:hypothetical protein
MVARAQVVELGGGERLDHRHEFVAVGARVGLQVVRYISDVHGDVERA